LNFYFAILKSTFYEIVSLDDLKILNRKKQNVQEMIDLTIFL